MRPKKNSELTSAQTLRWTYVDGIFFAIMVAGAESFALYYYAKQGISATELGLLSTVPILVAALFQLIIPSLIPHRRLGFGILLMIFVQFLGLSFLVVSVFLEDHFLIPLIALILYWVGGQCVGPLWLDWVAQFCPREKFEAFFGRRTATLQFVILFLLIGIAYAIDAGLSFFVLFGVSALCRLISMGIVTYTQLHSAPLGKALQAPNPLQDCEKPLDDALKQSLRIFFVFVAAGGLFRFAVNTSSPFFLSYMIHDLKLSTIDYVWLTSVPLIGKILFQINWSNGKLQGYQYLGVQVSCFVIAFLPWLFTLSTNFAYLVVIQIISGVFWGGIEFMHVMLAQNLAYGRSRRYAGIQQAIFQCFALGGALLGGALLDGRWSTFAVFELSTVLRFLAAVILAALAWKYSLSRMSIKRSFIYLTTVISIRPTAANVWRLIPVRARRRRPHQGQNRVR